MSKATRLHERTRRSLGNRDSSVPEYRRVGSPVESVIDRVPKPNDTITTALKGSKLSRSAVGRGPMG